MKSYLCLPQAAASCSLLQLMSPRSIRSSSPAATRERRLVSVVTLGIEQEMPDKAAPAPWQPGREQNPAVVGRVDWSVENYQPGTSSVHLGVLVMPLQLLTRGLGYSFYSRDVHVRISAEPR